MAEHTPGPWRVGDSPFCVVADVPAPNDATGHNAVDYYGGYLIAESIRGIDDARLIAAAPDLLTAAENALDWLENDLGPCEPDCECVIHGVRDAIARARGTEAVRSE